MVSRLYFDGVPMVFRWCLNGGKATEKWKSSKLEKWKSEAAIGKVEKWKSGKPADSAEKWKSETVSTFPLFHFSTFPIALSIAATVQAGH